MVFTPLDETLVAGQTGELADTQELHKAYNRGGLPVGARVAGTLAGEPALLLDAADSLTGWTAANFQTGLALDTVVKTEGTASVSATLWTGTGNQDLSTKMYVDLPAGVPPAGRAYVAVDFRWQDSGPGIGGAVDQIFALKIGSAVALGGTTAQAGIPSVPQSTFVTLLVPVGALTSVRSVGLVTIGVGASAGATSRAIVRLDNVRYLAASEVDKALASGDPITVLAFADLTLTQPQGRIDLPATKSFLDTRPGHERLSRENGVYSLRDWYIVEDGSEDVSGTILAAYSQVPEHSLIVAPPRALLRVDAEMRLTRSDVHLDFQGARLFFGTAGRVDCMFVLDGNAQGGSIRRMRGFGKRITTVQGAAFTTVAGTPTNVGFSDKALATQGDEIRSTLDINGEELRLSRDHRLLNEWTVYASASAGVAGDCQVLVYGIANDGTVTLRQTTTLPTLTTSFVGYPVTYRPVDLGERLKIHIKKAGATGTTVTIDKVDIAGQILYDGALEFSSGIRVNDVQGWTLDDVAFEGMTGDAVQGAGVAARDNKVLRAYSRGCSRQGMSFNQGKGWLIEDYTIREPHRSGIDVEPFADGWLVEDIIIRRGRSYNTRNSHIAGTNWPRIRNFTVEDVVGYGARNHFLSAGADGGTFRNLTSIGITAGAEYDFNFHGRNMKVEGINADRGVSDHEAEKLGVLPGYNTYDNISVRGVRYSNIRIRSIGSTLGESSLANATDPFATGSGTYTGPVELPSGIPYGPLDLSRHTVRYPKTFPAPAESSRWHPRGDRKYLEPLLEVRALSAGARRGTNLRGFEAVVVAAGATTARVAFPTHTVPAFTTRTLAGSTGGTLSPSTTYHYRIASRDRHGGPRLAEANQQIALSAAQNAVALTLGGWAEAGVALIEGFTVYRGLAAGVYNTRFDVLHDQDFFSVNQSGTGAFKDIGSAIIFTAVDQKEWGFPASTPPSAGESLVPADETGFEPDDKYMVFVELNWHATAKVVARTRGYFDLEFSAAAPAGGGLGSYFIVS